MRSYYMPFAYALITNQQRGAMPKRSELKLTKRIVDALVVEGEDAVPGPVAGYLPEVADSAQLIDMKWVNP